MFLFSFRRMYMFNSQDAYVYFLRIPPCILHACMIKSIWYVTWSCYISFPLLFFSCFFSLFLNTQNFPLRNVSFGYMLYRTVDRNFAYVILNIVKQKGIVWRTRSKLIQRPKRQWQSVPNITIIIIIIIIIVIIITKEVTRKPLTLSFLLGGDNRKYNPHSRVPFSNFGVLKNFTPESPLSSMTRIGTWALWRSSLINLLKIILISTKKDVFINKNLCHFSTEKIGQSYPNVERGTGNGEWGVSVQR